MSQTPPPPPGATSGGVTRPGLVTAAAVLMFVGGGFGVLAGILGLAGGGMLGGAFGGALAVISIIVLAIGGLEIWVGVQVLALKETGRIIGIVLAGISGLLSLAQLGDSAGNGILGIAINGFIIYALVTTKQYFTR